MSEPSDNSCGLSDILKYVGAEGDKGAFKKYLLVAAFYRKPVGRLKSSCDMFVSHRNCLVSANKQLLMMMMIKNKKKLTSFC